MCRLGGFRRGLCDPDPIRRARGAVVLTWQGLAEIALFVAVIVAVIRPFGDYMARAMQGEWTPLRPVIGPLERAIYWLAGVDAEVQQGWRDYAKALLTFQFVGILALYATQRLQTWLPFNPQHFAPVAPDLALNTAVSFVTNTSWQGYAGEQVMSHLTQMAGITVQSFLSGATGIAVAIALVRGLARRNSGTIGNFWTDLTRATLYILLPVCVVASLIFVWQGAPQTLVGSVEATTLEGASQVIALGPVASQEAIKLLGGDGGGFFNANSAHPFENPTRAQRLRPDGADLPGGRRPHGDVRPDGW